MSHVTKFKNRVYKLIIASAIFLSSPVFADDAARERLIVLLEQYQTLSANFIQQTQSESAFDVQESTGLFKITKPLKFFWFTKSPLEQQVVSDGEMIWSYDPDLEQATYQLVGNSLRQSPALILSQPRESLTSQYEVLEAKGDELLSYRLYPNDDDSIISELTIVFENSVISEIRFLDSLGQDTRLYLSEVKTNTKIDETIYSFEPPEGTDLFEQM